MLRYYIKMYIIYYDDILSYVFRKIISKVVRDKNISLPFAVFDWKNIYFNKTISQHPSFKYELNCTYFKSYPKFSLRIALICLYSTRTDVNSKD